MKKLKGVLIYDDKGRLIESYDSVNNFILVVERNATKKERERILKIIRKYVPTKAIVKDLIVKEIEEQGK